MVEQLKSFAPLPAQSRKGFFFSLAQNSLLSGSQSEFTIHPQRHDPASTRSAGFSPLQYACVWENRSGVNAARRQAAADFSMRRNETFCREKASRFSAQDHLRVVLQTL